jgi:16S rRNA (cytosine1402-N4)-methyltransferase
MTIHKPVLLKEIIDNLNLKCGDIVVDATLGGGGHSREILKKIGKSGKLIAIDQDETAIKNFRKSFSDSSLDSQSKVIHLVQDNFSNLIKILGDEEVYSVTGILADLGISSDQLEDRKKGMSFQTDAELDMRMDEKQKFTAKKIINEWSQEQIENILRNYGEEKFARNISKKIIEERKKKEIISTLELAKIIKKAIPVRFQPRKINPATKSFQAFRIAVNDELGHLEKFIPDAIASLQSRGRLAIITFNSLEDRIVKNIFRQNARGCICPKDFPICSCGNIGKVKIITKKPIIPSVEEVRDNPRARSAKLRVCEKI